MEALGASDRVVAAVVRDALGRRSSRGRRPTPRRISRQLTHVGSSRSPSILSRRTPSRGDQSDRSVKQLRLSSTTGAAAVDTVFIDGGVKKWGGELVGVDYAQLAREGEASRTYLLARFGVPTDEMRAAL
jgi:hypothetical protein